VFAVATPVILVIRVMSGPKSVKRVSVVVHDLKSPLMSILVNAEHLEAIAQAAPELRNILASASLDPEQTRALVQLLDELLPISADLITATRRLRSLLDKLEPSDDSPEAGSISPLRSYGT
jgi:hypothetical protein